MYNLALSSSYYASIVNIVSGNCVNNHCMNFRQFRSIFYIGTIVETLKCIVDIHRAMSSIYLILYIIIIFFHFISFSFSVL